MTWDNSWPNGAVSVKANKSQGVNNMTYINTVMGSVASNTVNNNTTPDHFWNQGSPNDGRHRYINMPKFTVSSVDADPVLGLLMDGNLYFKQVNSDVGRVEAFYQNTNGIYQLSPSFLTGSASITSTSTFVNVVAVPINVYGEIFMYKSTSGAASAVVGFFKSTATTCDAWAIKESSQGTSDAVNALKFGNGSDVSGLNIRARLSEGSSGTWNYRITYRAL